MRPARNVQCFWSKPGSPAGIFAIVIVGFEYYYRFGSREHLEVVIVRHGSDMTPQAKDGLNSVLAHLPERSSVMLETVRGRQIIFETTDREKQRVPLDEAFWEGR